MKLFDRLIDHVVDRVMARAKHNRPTFTVNNVNVDPILAGRGINYGSHAGAAAAQAFAEGVAGASPAMQHPGRTA